MKVIIDVFGGDYGAAAAVSGGALAARQRQGLELVFAGDSALIEPELKKHSVLTGRAEVLHAPEGITNDEAPTVAIRNKKQSSLVRALDLLKEDGADALVSAGSTGALLTGGLFKIGRIRGVSRPALCPILPTISGGSTALVDAGANVDCKPVHLSHFAVMGTAYMRTVMHIDSPRVALLSNGTEEKKGNELNKEAYELLKGMAGINFVGNLEARDLLSGQADVIVADGFAGNIALKSYEGCARTVFSLLKKEISSGFLTKIGALLLKSGFKRVAGALDYNKVGGALILGLEKAVIKVHGSSKDTAFCAAVLQAADMHEGGVTQSIKQRLLTDAPAEV